ncbi:DUF4255 domain-containing protein [Oscillochloris sp. ZM17-4]|uniref:DUF4255 domain-containing protein n=1 Tax=Oscillochloris sp. ZM17-4 TaxID=2866714 RepID=UPI001C72C73E|nr:DUF4255 domain-containing protein [Oscillochloris sp. ZM17-4]MBX0328462.1 DUF4255 domain-containing protein [Oscillochloris sp. ZM17-4]
MINRIHSTIDGLLRAEDGFPADSLAIAFCPPTAAWLERSGPRAINFYLLGLRENSELRRADMPTLRGPGQASRRVPPRMFDLRYLVSAYDKEEPANEYALLWATLIALLRHDPLPAERLPAPLQALGLPIAARIVADEPVGELWSLLGQLPRPAISYSVTVPAEITRPQRWGLVAEPTVRVAPLGEEDPALRSG